MFQSLCCDSCDDIMAQSKSQSKWEWSHLVMSNSAAPWTEPTRLLHPWDSPGKNTGVGCHSLLQGIFPTQGSNLGPPHCRQTFYIWATREVTSVDVTPARGARKRLSWERICLAMQGMWVQTPVGELRFPNVLEQLSPRVETTEPVHQNQRVLGLCCA